MGSVRDVAHLHDESRRLWDLPSDPECLVQVGALEQIEAAELLPALGERPIGDEILT
jgi:hypothetical protein